jgi:hypothetical protein
MNTGRASWLFRYPSVSQAPWRAWASDPSAILIRRGIIAFASGCCASSSAAQPRTIGDQSSKAITSSSGLIPLRSRSKRPEALTAAASALLNQFAWSASRPVSRIFFKGSE